MGHGLRFLSLKLTGLWSKALGKEEIIARLATIKENAQHVPPEGRGEAPRLCGWSLKFMKTALSLFTLASLLLTWRANAQTNSAWSTTVDAFHFEKAPIIHVFKSLEVLSRNLDPEGKGVRILLPLMDNVDDGELSCHLTDVPVLDCLTYLCELVDYRLFILDDVAVIAHPSHGYRLLTFHGKCIDAITGYPIYNLEIESPIGLPTQIAISTNGHYVCAKPILDIGVGYYGDTLLTKKDSERLEAITASAPGYKSRIYELPIRGGRFGYNPLVIELYPKNEFQHAPPAGRGEAPRP